MQYRQQINGYFARPLNRNHQVFVATCFEEKRRTLHSEHRSANEMNGTQKKEDSSVEKRKKKTFTTQSSGSRENELINV